MSDIMAKRRKQDADEAPAADGVKVAEFAVIVDKAEPSEEPAAEAPAQPEQPSRAAFRPDEFERRCRRAAAALNGAADAVKAGDVNVAKLQEWTQRAVNESSAAHEMAAVLSVN